MARAVKVEIDPDGTIRVVPYTEEAQGFVTAKEHTLTEEIEGLCDHPEELNGGYPGWEYAVRQGYRIALRDLRDRLNG